MALVDADVVDAPVVAVVDGARHRRRRPPLAAHTRLALLLVVVVVVVASLVCATHAQDTSTPRPLRCSHTGYARGDWCSPRAYADAELDAPLTRRDDAVDDVRAATGRAFAERRRLLSSSRAAPTMAAPRYEQLTLDRLEAVLDVTLQADGSLVVVVLNRLDSSPVAIANALDEYIASIVYTAQLTDDVVAAADAMALRTRLDVFIVVYTIDATGAEVERQVAPVLRAQFAQSRLRVTLPASLRAQRVVVRLELRNAGRSELRTLAATPGSSLALRTDFVWACTDADIATASGGGNGAERTFLTADCDANSNGAFDLCEAELCNESTLLDDTAPQRACCTCGTRVLDTPPDAAIADVRVVGSEILVDTVETSLGTSYVALYAREFSELDADASLFTTARTSLRYLNCPLAPLGQGATRDAPVRFDLADAHANGFFTVCAFRELDDTRPVGCASYPNQVAEWTFGSSVDTQLTVDEHPLVPPYRTAHTLSGTASWLASSQDAASVVFQGVAASPHRLQAIDSSSRLPGDFTLAKGSVLFWMRSSASTANVEQVLLDRRASDAALVNITGGAGGMTLSLTVTGALRVSTYDDDGVRSSATATAPPPPASSTSSSYSPALNNGQWHHIVVTWDTTATARNGAVGELRTFIDGKERTLTSDADDGSPSSTRVPTFEWPSATTPWRFGWSATTSSMASFTGEFESVRLFAEPVAELLARVIGHNARQALVEQTPPQQPNVFDNSELQPADDNVDIIVVESAPPNADVSPLLALNEQPPEVYVMFVVRDGSADGVVAVERVGNVLEDDDVLAAATSSIEKRGVSLLDDVVQLHRKRQQRARSGARCPRRRGRGCPRAAQRGRPATRSPVVVVANEDGAVSGLNCGVGGCNDVVSMSLSRDGGRTTRNVRIGRHRRSRGKRQDGDDADTFTSIDGLDIDATVEDPVNVNDKRRAVRRRGRSSVAIRSSSRVLVNALDADDVAVNDDSAEAFTSCGSGGCNDVVSSVRSRATGARRGGRRSRNVVHARGSGRRRNGKRQVATSTCKLLAAIPDDETFLFRLRTFDNDGALDENEFARYDAALATIAASREAGGEFAVVYVDVLDCRTWVDRFDDDGVFLPPRVAAVRGAYSGPARALDAVALRGQGYAIVGEYPNPALGSDAHQLVMTRITRTGAQYTDADVVVAECVLRSSVQAMGDYAVVSWRSCTGQWLFQPFRVDTAVPPPLDVDRCGNGVLDLGEQCDPGAGNFDATVADTCRPGCRLPRCGDGVVDRYEQCDNGDAANARASSTCRPNGCTLRRCGDGVLDNIDGFFAETCDLGALNSAVSTLLAACRPDCTRCGDGVVDTAHGEQCDDGDRASPTCPACQLAATPPQPGSCVSYCGLSQSPDGVCYCDAACRDAATGRDDCCDDFDTECPSVASPPPTAPPATTGGSCAGFCNSSPNSVCYCTSDCEASGDCCGDYVEQCAVADVVCGNGIVELGEQCDVGDGNFDDSGADGCRSGCVGATCGDSVVDSHETCDEGTATNGFDATVCRIDCTRCGDGVVDAGEVCDVGDGNFDDTGVDGCRSGCVKALCGDGVTDSGETCDEGTATNGIDATVCRANCTRCGDGVLDAGEQCDLGDVLNASPFSTCTINCTSASPLSWVQVGDDLGGEAAGDQFGFAVSMSDDGARIAIGGPFHDGSGTNAGLVRVYQLNATGSWSQLGDDIDDDSGAQLSGFSVSLSLDGSRIAVGFPFDDFVRVYDTSSGSWAQLGNDIIGEYKNDEFGKSVSLNSDGSRLAVGAPANSDDGSNSSVGHVRVYEFASGVWTQLGFDLDGEAEGDESGCSVSLSSDGLRVAIGARANNGDFVNSHIGHVRIYEYSSGAWSQLGSDIDGAAMSEHSGTSVSLGADGSIVAIGAPVDRAGRVRVFKYSAGSSAWSKIGDDIDGEAAGDYFGNSVSLSSDGTRVAIGSSYHSTSSSHVRVYEYAGGAWVQLAVDIEGEAPEDDWGRSVSLSSDGSRVLVGAPFNDNAAGIDAGHARVFALAPVTCGNGATDASAGETCDEGPLSNGADASVCRVDCTRCGDGVLNLGEQCDLGDTRKRAIIDPPSGCESDCTLSPPVWVQTGNDVDGETAGDRSGTSVSMSSDGLRMAVGAPNNGNVGHARVFEFTSGTWSQLGDNIDGHQTGELAGRSVSMSSDGACVAMGAPSNDEDGPATGHARVYTFGTGAWTQLGDNLAGDVSGATFGWIVSLNRDCSRVAVSAPSGGTGYVRVFAFNASDAWSQIGDDLVGDANDDLFGTGLSLSSNGSRVAIGAPTNSISSTGFVRVFEFNASSVWSQLGDDLVGEATGDLTGTSTSLSADGSRVAIGSPDGSSGAGHVRVFEFAASSNEWRQLGFAIVGEATGDRSGIAVSLSSDGTRVTIGAPDNHATHGSYAGHVRVYEFASGEWTQVGEDIDAEAPADDAGVSVSLNSDGTRVAMGAPNNDVPGNNAGHARVFALAPVTCGDGVVDTFIGETCDEGSSNGDDPAVCRVDCTRCGDGVVDLGEQCDLGDLLNAFRLSGCESNCTLTPSEWVQLGDDIDGEAASDQSGDSVSLSADGLRVAIGARLNDGAGSNAGRVRVYHQYTIDTWTQIGNDIDGEAMGDTSGFSVSLSSDGERVAIGARSNDGSGTESGHVRVYALIANTWTQLGADIDGKKAGDQFGSTASLNSDGTRLAVGAPRNGAGYAQVLEFNGSDDEWIQMGDDIVGDNGGDEFGYEVSLSSDGLRVAIGAPNSGGYAGLVRVFEFNASNVWSQLGDDFIGEAANDECGTSTALSADGSRVAIGSPFNENSGGLNNGNVRVFEFAASSGVWKQLGDAIIGEKLYGRSGSAVSISSDGTRVAIGAPNNDDVGTNAGQVRVYEYASSTWSHVGQKIDGEAANDNSGTAVSLSSNGTRVAIGAPHNNNLGGNLAGHTRVFAMIPAL